MCTTPLPLSQAAAAGIGTVD